MFYLKLISLILPFTIYFVLKETKVYCKRFFFYYLLFTIANSILTIGFVKNQELYYYNNLIFTPFEYVFFALIIRNLSVNFTFRKVIMYTIAGYLLLWLTYTANYGKQQFDSIPVIFEHLILIILCLIYYFEKMKDPEAVFIYTTPGFWAVSTIFIYCSGTLFAYSFANFFLQNSDFLDQYRLIHYGLSIVKNIMIAGVFFVKSKKVLLINPNSIYSTNLPI